MLTNRLTRTTLLFLSLLLLALAPIAAPSQTNLPASATATPPPSSTAALDQSNAERVKQRWILSTLIVVLLGIGTAYLVRKPQNATAK